MAFQQGLSGLSAASQSLNVISNNVSNASTVGFKLSNAQFADMYASALNGTTSSKQSGIGTQVTSVAQLFAQGDIASTDNPLDIAINGEGFFCMQRNGTNAYSRNGQFHLDKNGYIINSQGANLSGYAASPTGAILQATPGPLHVDAASIAPKQTTSVSLGLNLDSSSAVPATAWTSGTASPPTTSYNNSTSTTVYDSLGNSHVVTAYFRTAGAGNWDMYYQIDGGATQQASPAINFNSTGQLTTAMPLTLSGLTVNTGASSPISISLDLTGSTQYGSPFARNTIEQDGYSSGSLSSLGVSEEGKLEGSYSNGQMRTLGQVVLAKFANPQGLTVLGNNLWAESAASGQAVVGAPNTGTLGVVTGGAVENSNVDLTHELVNLITAQRNYQANAQSIKTEDAIMQTLVNLR